MIPRTSSPRPTSSPLLILVLLITMPAAAQDRPQESAKAAAAWQLAAERVFYPLRACPVSSSDLGDPTIIDVVHKGRLVRVCCNNCTAEVADNLDRILPVIDRAYIRTQRPRYPLTHCAVDRRPLGEKSPGVDFLHGIRLVRVCSDACKRAFARKPRGFMTRIDQALIERQARDYRFVNCPISGQALDGVARPQRLLFHTRLVQLCSPACVAKFRADPAAAIKKLRVVPQKRR